MFSILNSNKESSTQSLPLQVGRSIILHWTNNEKLKQEQCHWNNQYSVMLRILDYPQQSVLNPDTFIQTSFTLSALWNEALYWAMIYELVSCCIIVEVSSKCLFRLLTRASISLLMLSSFAYPLNFLTAMHWVFHFSSCNFSSAFGCGGFPWKWGDTYILTL